MDVALVQAAARAISALVAAGITMLRRGMLAQDWPGTHRQSI
ncbi:hypothetical protein [Streptomyces sp. NBC_00344]